MVLVINICLNPLHYFEFVKPVEDILRNNNIKFTTKNYRYINKATINKADKIIICGTSLADNKFIDDIDKFKFILTFTKPVLGICGGAHIIGLLLGKNLVKEEAIGMKEINFEKPFLGVSGKREVYHLHQFRVLPEVFHESHFYATLFHPEVRNKEMIVNFAKL